MCYWIGKMSANFVLLDGFSTLEIAKEEAGLGEWPMFVMDIVSRNPRKLTLCTRDSVWRRIHFLSRVWSFSLQRTNRKSLENKRIVWQIVFLLRIFCKLSLMFNESPKPILNWEKDKFLYVDKCEFFILHLIFKSFIYVSYWKLVRILTSIFELFKRSNKTWSRYCF